MNLGFLISRINFTLEQIQNFFGWLFYGFTQDQNKSLPNFHSKLTKMIRIKVVTFTCIMVVGLAACFPLSNKSDLKETPTPPPTIATLTNTIEWFPPTSTYTPLPAGTLGVISTPVISPNHGEMIFEDNFIDSSAWELGEYMDGIIVMDNNELSLAIKKADGYLSSIRYGTDLGDYSAEITVNPTICRDMDEYGIIYRVTSSEDFYRFSLTCDGKARLDRLFKGQASSPQPLITHGSIPPGAPSISRLGVWVSGEEMHFFVNGNNIFTVNDPSITHGGFGVFVRAAGEDETTVNFSDLVVYEVNP